MITWHLEKMKLSQLKPHSKNPRILSKHDAEHLQKSLEKFGLIDKPVITGDGRVIGGHQRLKILKQMKVKEVECYVPDNELSERDIDELNIRLNKNTGEFDFDILANEWEADCLMEWGFEDFELGIDKEIEQIEDEEKPKEKKKKICPQCGHEF